MIFDLVELQASQSVALRRSSGRWMNASDTGSGKVDKWDRAPEATPEQTETVPQAPPAQGGAQPAAAPPKSAAMPYYDGAIATDTQPNFGRW